MPLLKQPRSINNFNILHLILKTVRVSFLDLLHIAVAVGKRVRAKFLNACVSVELLMQVLTLTFTQFCLILVWRCVRAFVCQLVKGPLLLNGVKQPASGV